MQKKKKDLKFLEETRRPEISRRDFIKVTAAGVAGVVAVSSLNACATEPAAGGGSGGSSLSGGGKDVGLIEAASINPQDYNFKQNTITDWSATKLFSPLQFGSIALNHRMIKSAAGSATYLQGPTEELFQHYVNMAKGGVEFIWVESIAWMGPGSHPVIKVPLPAAVDFGKRLVAECAKYGCSLGMQWGAFSMKPLSELTKADFMEAQENGVATARWYQDMGFKALEIHMTGTGGLTNALLTRVTNNRKDEYGPQTLENRARFSVETIQKIKKACGNDFVLEALVESATENNNITNNVGEAFMWMDRDITLAQNRMTTIEEAIEFAKLFEAAGLDAIQCRIGTHGYHPGQFASDLYFILNGLEGQNAFGTQFDFKRHFQGQMIGNHSGAGMLLNVAQRYKKALKKTVVGAVTYMDPRIAPDFFENALKDGKLDYYAMTRPLTVDPEYVNKLRDGRIDEIAPCTRCLHCHIGSNESNRQFGYCRVNALTQRVLSGIPGTPNTYELPPLSGPPKKVMVIGGGPGGMEAARIAAARGHNVTLYEKSPSLGGRLDFVIGVKGPHENLREFKAYLIRQLEINKVKVVLNKEVDTAFINAEKPDAVILAVGGVHEQAPVTGNASIKVVDYDSFMGSEVGQNVIIYGSNAQAWDAALWLTVHGKNVQIVTPKANEELDIQQSQHEMRFMTTALYSLGVKAWHSSVIKSVGDHKITIKTDYSVDIDLPADTIITGAELEPNKSLLDGVTAAQTFAVGDCDKPYNIALAIRGGNDAGRAV
jgi:2,4-dienoyl-CoA reductase-like NADH-dependent reductase (Old Yellow Enzyme family)/thioredoxin reductase